MAYATYQNIQEEFKKVSFSSGQPVTDTQVTRFITEAEAEINGRVGKVYQVPVDSGASPDSFAILRSISIGIVAQRVRDILEVKTADDKTSQKGRADSAKSSRDMLEDIVNQKLILRDAVKISTSDGVKSFGQTETHPFVFQRGQRQW